MARRLRIVGLGAAGAVMGLAAESIAYAWADTGDWLPDLLTGWTLVGSGLVAMAHRPKSRIGALLVAAGLTWFLGNFAHVDWPPAAWLGSELLFLHRAPLIQCVLCFPTGRLTTRHAQAVTLAGYVTGLVAPLGRSDLVTLALGLLVTVCATADFARAVGQDRRARARSLPAGILLGLSLVALAVLHRAYPAGGPDAALLRGYEVVLAVVAVDLAVALVDARWERADLTDLVVALAEDRSGTLRDALARALGDPSLQIGYRLADSDCYTDAEGRMVDVTHIGPRVLTRVPAHGPPLAVVIHDPAVLGNAALVGAVESATQLAASNMRLQAEVRAKLADLSASRRRLVSAGDDERQRIEQRLREGAEQRLNDLAVALDEIHRQAARGACEVVMQPLTRARERLETTLTDLRHLAQGLYPATLTERGLAAAVGELAEQHRLPVTVAISADGLPLDVASAAYFVCAEALTNIDKHAHGSRCSVSIQRHASRVHVEVADDGVGGADLAGGSGLRGLADRVGAMGGTLAVRSALGAGTVVVADLPLDA
ncbi:MAG TPA: ATP-binding protein [Jatrophihabitans sp.]|nr:ATP-binding protein [Jatrophihabitans sp.]